MKFTSQLVIEEVNSNSGNMFNSIIIFLIIMT